MEKIKNHPGIAMAYHIQRSVNFHFHHPHYLLTAASSCWDFLCCCVDSVPFVLIASGIYFRDNRIKQHEYAASDKSKMTSRGTGHFRRRYFVSYGV